MNYNFKRIFKPPTCPRIEKKNKNNRTYPLEIIQSLKPVFEEYTNI